MNFTGYGLYFGEDLDPDKRNFVKDSLALRGTAKNHVGCNITLLHLYWMTLGGLVDNRAYDELFRLW